MPTAATKLQTLASHSQPVSFRRCYKFVRTANSRAARVRSARPLRRCRTCGAICSGNGLSTSEGWFDAHRKRKDWSIGPALELSKEEAVHMQLEALQENNMPWTDHGVEVLYRFAAFDPFERSNYFGRSWDLGQFERFRRLVRDRPYNILLQHTERRTTSSLQVSDTRWMQRVWVRGFAGKQAAVFDFHMVRQVGGRYDGYWNTERLLCDGVETPCDS